ncbi:MAG: homoserine dehydrogenase [Desulfosarcina sp.]|nr:homoserine dehydrogenase [Desulfobacterales bacterium]
MKKINIGLLGCGTVGTGVAKMLIENRELIASRVGAKLVLKRIADIDINKERGIVFDDGIFTKDADEIISDPDIDIIVEMIGGKGIAKDFILKAIENGKQVVTANKALIAEHGNFLIKTAETKGVDFAFEASVGGCIPIVNTIRESLVGDKIKSMTGILNGTCNYILTKIGDDGSTFKEALAQAQDKGFAEADPTLDIEGDDTAHKLAIISSLAYGMKINLEDIYTEGISKISSMDIECAKEFNLKIKLLAISKNRGSRVEARVHPAMIAFDNLVSSVNGSMNAVEITGDAVGSMVLYGHGAGMMPTACAVVSDIVAIARNLLSNATGKIPILSCQSDKMSNISVLPIDEIHTYYYFRFSVLDRAGVLAKIAGILGAYSISLKYVTQKGLRSNGSITIVMFTHLAKEADVQKALSEIASLDVVTDIPVLIRIEDDLEKENGG